MAHLIDHFPLLAGWIFHFFTAMGMARIVCKPAMFLIQLQVKISDSVKEREWLANLKQNRFYRVVIWFVDYFGSIKLPGQP